MHTTPVYALRTEITKVSFKEPPDLDHKRGIKGLPKTLNVSMLVSAIDLCTSLFSYKF